MARLEYEITGDVSGLVSSVNQALGSFGTLQDTYDRLSQKVQQAGADSLALQGEILALKKSLDDGSISQAQYNQQVEQLSGYLRDTNSALAGYQQQLISVSKATQDLNATPINPDTSQLAGVNQQLGQLQNNLFGSRRIAIDFTRAIAEAPVSVEGFARNLGLLAVDFLFYSQQAQFAGKATAVAATEIEGAEVATTATAGGLGNLGAAFSSLLTPINAVVLVIGILAAGYVLYEKNEANAQKTATEHLKVLNQQKEALKDYITTLSAASQVEAASNDSVGNEIVKLNELYFAVKNNTGALFDGKSALEDLQDLYPAFFGNVDTAASKTDALTKAYSATSDALQALGRFTAASKLAEQSTQDSLKNQVVADSFLVPLNEIKKQLDAATKAFKDENQSLTNAFSGPGGGGASTPAIGLNALQKQYDSLIDTIQGYNEKVAAANKQTQAFYDIANKNAPAAGKLTPNPDTFTSVNDPFEEINLQITGIINKTNELNNSSGLSGYAAEVQKITKEYDDLDLSIAKIIDLINKDAAAGTLDKSEAAQLVARLTAGTSSASGNEDAALNQAKIADAQKTADAIQKINDTFHVKAQASRDTELASVQKLYDEQVAAANSGVLTLAQIQDRYNSAISSANGNQQLIIDAGRVRDAEIQAANDASAKVIAIEAGKISAIQAIDAKYLLQVQDLYAKISDLALQNANALGTVEQNATGKIVLEFQKRLESANKYFQSLRDLARAGTPGLSIDSINAQQSQFNAQNQLAEARQVSIEISKPFSQALQSSITDFATSFYTAITTLGAQRQAIDDKYLQQYQSATTDLARQQIDQQKQIELAATTSFGAVFSSVISSTFASFNKSIVDSFTKKFTENIASTIIKPTDDQLGLKASSVQFSGTVTNAAQTFANIIDQSATNLAAKLQGGESTALLGGASPLQGINAATSNFSTEVNESSAKFSAGVAAGAHEAAATTTEAATTAASTTTVAAAQLSAKIAGAAAALSVVGSLISGATSPTSTVGQGVGGLLQGAGEGALVGSVLGPEGTIAGAVIGGAIGLISGIFGASKAKKAEELQQQQLAAQQETNALLARQNALAYTSSIIGRMTTQGIVTSADINAFGQLTATISGKNIQFVLDRNSNGR